MKNIPCLYLVIPCFNEQDVLPLTAPLFLQKIERLAKAGKISPDSRILFVNDGSRDRTWEIICGLSNEDAHYRGISLSRNRGQENAIFAGLMEAKEKCDICISADCDGQDDINAIDAMVDAWWDGCDVVYGVHNKREADSFFKRFTAESFYRVMNWMEAEIVFNHADYRLLSRRVLEELAKYKEVNIFLRGMVPMIGFKSTCVYYGRSERVAGKTRWPYGKLLALAIDGITSVSVKPIRLISVLGFIFAILGFIGIVWNVVGKTAAHWESILCCVSVFIAGIQFLCLGILGEYIGKTYLESKARPKYSISERTY